VLHQVVVGDVVIMPGDDVYLMQDAYEGGSDSEEEEAEACEVRGAAEPVCRAVQAGQQSGHRAPCDAGLPPHVCLRVATTPLPPAALRCAPRPAARAPTPCWSAAAACVASTCAA
jgi:hypothetical protein